MGLKRDLEAASHYREALRLRPGWWHPANNLAWMLATHHDPEFRDPDEALSIAEVLMQTSRGEQPIFLDTIAAVQAAAGRFDDARQTAVEAVAHARAEGSEELARTIEARLALYRADRAYVEPASAD